MSVTLMKVKDKDGREIRGVFRGSNGALIVNDMDMLSKHRYQTKSIQEDKSKIKSLESEVAELRDIVNRLLMQTSCQG